MTAAIKEVDDLVLFCEDITEKYEDLDVVAEQGPSWGGHSRHITEEREAVVKRFFPDATWTTPGQWKGHPAVRHVSLRGTTQHEKDAACLGCWHNSLRRARANKGTSAAEDLTIPT